MITTILTAACAMFASGGRADNGARALVLFQAKAGTPLEARELDLETGDWRTVWTRSLEWKGARAIFFVPFADRVGLLLAIGSERRYAEFSRSDGKAVGWVRKLDPTVEALVSAAGSPLALGSRYPQLIWAATRPSSGNVGGLQAEWRGHPDGFNLATITPNGKYQVQAYTFARAGSSGSWVNCYRIGRPPRTVTENLMPGQAGVGSLAATNSVVAIAAQRELQLYSVGPSGLRLMATSSLEPGLDNIFPTPDGRGFYGQTQGGLIAIYPLGKGWARKRLIDLDLDGYWPGVRLLQTLRHLALVVPSKGLYRMRHNPDGTLTLLEREEVPAGWVPSG